MSARGRNVVLPPQHTQVLLPSIRKRLKEDGRDPTAVIQNQGGGQLPRIKGRLKFKASPPRPPSPPKQRHLVRNQKPRIDVGRSFFKAPIATAETARQKLIARDKARLLSRKKQLQQRAPNTAPGKRNGDTEPNRPSQLTGPASPSRPAPRIVVAEPSKKRLYQQLKSLCAKNDRDMLRTLVGAKVDIDTSSPSGHTVLMHVAGLGDPGLPMLEFLLAECGANPNCQTTQGSTALHVASERRRISSDIVQVLKRYGADPSIKDRLGRTAKDVFRRKQAEVDGKSQLLHAVQRGNLDAVESILSLKVSVDTVNSAGQTVLMLAVQHTHVGLVRLLLRRKADPNAKEPEDEMTALHFAQQQERYTNPSMDTIVRLLEEHGASNVIHNRFGLTPSEWSDRLLKESNGNLPESFKRACVDGDEDAILQVLVDGPDVRLLNARDEIGRTPLIHATMGDHAAVCRQLLKAKANPDLKEVNHRGNTALHYAHIQGNAEIIELLEDYNADSTITNALGFDCLAVENNAKAREQRKRRQKHSKHTLSRNSFRNGRVPQKADLHEAICVKFSKMEARRLLRDQYPSFFIDGQDMFGNTYLMQLVQMGSESSVMMASWIIDNLDADMDIQNNRGWTALHLAYDQEHRRMASLLEYKGADDTIRDSIGFTAAELPLRHAAQERQAEIQARKKALHRESSQKWVNKDFAAACRQQDYDEVRDLLEDNDVNINAHVVRGGDTMLIEATRHKDIELVKILVAGGADINATNQAGDTAVHVAAMEGHDELFNFLLEQCDPPFDHSLTNNFGYTIKNLRNLHKHGTMDAAARLARERAPKIQFNHQLDSCAMVGDVAGTKQVIGQLKAMFEATMPKSGPEPDAAELLANPSMLVETEPAETADDLVAKVLNCKSSAGSTVLIRAVENRHKNVVELLLEKGADPNIQNARGLTALHAASALVPPDKDMADLLILHGASDAVTTKVGITATAMFLNVRRMLKFAKRESASARFERHLEQSGIVLAHVQDIAIADELEQPARIADLQDYLTGLLEDDSVFRSRENREIDVSSIINNQIRNGESPAFNAIRLDCEEALDVLLDFGADANSKNANGSSMLHIAYEIGNPDIIALLTSLGADPSMTDSMGNTPLQHGRHHAEIRRRENRRRAAKLMAVEYNFFYELADELKEAVCIGDLDGIRLACEDGAPINGQAPDIELKNFFALSRFSGSVTQQLQKVAPAALEAVSGSRSEALIPNNWSKLRAGMKGHSAMEGLLGISSTSHSQPSATTNAAEDSDAARLRHDQQQAKAEYHAATDVPGSTALMAAAWRGDLEATKLLVHLKANPNIHNSDHVSALHCALARNHKKIVEWLLNLKQVQKLSDLQDVLLLQNGETPTTTNVRCPFKLLLPKPKM